mmetsp:Transcript_10787/g.45938  ORF Transcript_10787/g.45938 Transcript_10787/m.45938 type:complete len:225 (+) Transcript_10787:558-1232(+)
MVRRREALAGEQRAGFSVFAAGHRVFNSGLHPDRRDPAHGALLLRHLLGVLHAGHGHRGEILRRAHQAAVPARGSRARRGRPALLHARPRGHRHPGHLRRAHAPHGPRAFGEGAREGPPGPAQVLQRGGARVLRGAPRDHRRDERVQSRAAGAAVHRARRAGRDVRPRARRGGLARDESRVGVRRGRGGARRGPGKEDQVMISRGELLAFRAYTVVKKKTLRRL